MSSRVFNPSSKMYFLTANVAAPTPIKPVPIDTLTEYAGAEVKITNTGIYLAYVSYGGTAAVATTNAVVPSAGNPQTVVAVLPSSEVVFHLPRQSHFTAVSSAATNLLFQLGEGF